MNQIAISLAGHTNNGKTTLARTLLRRDIGIVDNRPHVTDIADGHILQGDDNAQIALWDLPGFGDSIRLKKRLSQTGLIAWLMTTFDRWRDRPLWCSQKCLENVKDKADAILYLVDAGADPQASSQIHAELEVLAEIGKPVILLLNQTGHPDQDRDDALVSQWLNALEKFAFIKGAMPLDGWMRCWIQESVLFDRIAEILPSDKQGDFNRLIAVWKTANHDVVFDSSIDILSRAMAETAGQVIILEKESLIEKAAQLVTRRLSENSESAKRQLSEAWIKRTRASMEELLTINMLEGTPQEHEDAMLHGIDAKEADFPPEAWGMIAAIGGGALGGLIADALAGGLTFAGGAVTGGFLGGFTAYAMGRGYQIIKGKDGRPRLQWSKDFLISEWKASGIRYLTIAHFGRGKGAWDDTRRETLPARWNEQVEQWTKEHESEIASALKQGSKEQIKDLLYNMIREVLNELYPGAITPSTIK